MDDPKYKSRRFKKMKVDGPQKCMGGQKGMKMYGPKMRDRSRRDESGRSQNAFEVKKG